MKTVEIYFGKIVFRETSCEDDLHEDFLIYTEKNIISDEYYLFEKITDDSFLNLETSEILTNKIKKEIVYKEVEEYKQTYIVKYGVCDLELAYNGIKSNEIEEELLNKKNTKNKVKTKIIRT